MRLGWVAVIATGCATFIAMPANARCSLPPGWNKLVPNAAHYVVFGETHGSAEVPAMVGEIACAIANRGQRLLVAVELSATQNDGLQRAWALPHAEFEVALPQTMSEWTTRNDGVTSRAMFALLVRLHDLKSRGRSIDVVAFNGARDAAQRERFKHLSIPGAHEAAQAENIRIADMAATHDRVLVLSGSFHARKKVLTFNNITYEPMAMRLADPVRIASFYLAHGPGTSWNCVMTGDREPGVSITSDMVQCGAHGGRGDVDWVGIPRMVDTHGVAGPGNPDGAYDGTWFIGPITASPPIGATR